MSDLTVLLNNHKVTLGQNEYKAQGGQGTVYVKGGLAYKIYHDPKHMIPEAKIKELTLLQSIPAVLGPKDILYNSKTNTPVGFTMPFVSDVEYLTKMFSRNFKDNNGITSEMIVNLTVEMQKSLTEIHKHGVLVGDYNEMNFLVNSTFTIPYYIDVDSYQTRTFPCTAIMDTVRDRRLPFGKFDEVSDWFSWAVVTFQMYTGVHPYMGRHPSYKPSELDARMVNRISVFDPAVKLPKGCQDFSAIPQNMLEWYKKVFIDGFRSVPPIAGAFGCIPGYTAITSITGAGIFTVDLIHDYGETIIATHYYNGMRYIVTMSGIYKKERDIFTFTTKPKGFHLINFFGGDPIISVFQNGKVGFFDLSKNLIGEIAADGVMLSNGIFYTVHNGKLIENAFKQFSKLSHVTYQIDNISSTFKIFEGVIIQDVFGKRRLSIPYESRKCAAINVPQLEGYRIIDAKRDGRFCVIIAEQKGKYDRFVLYFNKDFTSYEIRHDIDIQYRDVNMCVKQNGMMASIVNDNTLELMFNLSTGSKEITDCPVELDMPLIDGIDRTLFISGTKLYSLKMS